MGLLRMTCCTQISCESAMMRSKICYMFHVKFTHVVFLIYINWHNIQNSIAIVDLLNNLSQNMRNTRNQRKKCSCSYMSRKIYLYWTKNYLFRKWHRQSRVIKIEREKPVGAVLTLIVCLYLAQRSNRNCKNFTLIATFSVINRNMQTHAFGAENARIRDKLSTFYTYIQSERVADRKMFCQHESWHQ